MSATLIITFIFFSSDLFEFNMFFLYMDLLFSNTVEKEILNKIIEFSIFKKLPIKMRSTWRGNHIHFCPLNHIFYIAPIHFPFMPGSCACCYYRRWSAVVRLTFLELYYLSTHLLDCISAELEDQGSNTDCCTESSPARTTKKHNHFSIF